MDHAPGTTHEAVDLDPENDIDAKSATRWVIGGTVVLFLSLWLLVPIFVQIQDFEHRRKVNEAETPEIENIVEAEESFLGGENPTKKDIETIIDSMRR
ncbi:MAG: hypothetical protein AB8H80_04020 [Planctomycetota bacterium]